VSYWKELKKKMKKATEKQRRNMAPQASLEIIVHGVSKRSMLQGLRKESILWCLRYEES
jgi:hydroxymethylpyrimidine pyrophosphatase-like HAD family hydrolase